MGYSLARSKAIAFEAMIPGSNPGALANQQGNISSSNTTVVRLV
jgi:hypothetical protein